MMKIDSYQVYLQRQHTHYVVSADQLLLPALLQQSARLEYQCEQGFCGSCRVVLIQGSIVYGALAMACLQPSEILLCVAYARSDLILDL